MRRFSVVLLLASPFLYGASYDCTKAVTLIEQSICSNRQLSALDDALAVAYKKALNISLYSRSIEKNQRNWLQLIRNTCQTKTCLNSAYTSRIAELNQDTDFLKPYLLLGECKIRSFMKVGGTAMSNVTINEIFSQNCTIDKKFIFFDGLKCIKPHYEVQKIKLFFEDEESYEKGSAPYYQIKSTLKTLVIACEETKNTWTFDILDNDTLGYYGDGRYFYLVRKNMMNDNIAKQGESCIQSTCGQGLVCLSWQKVEYDSSNVFHTCEILCHDDSIFSIQSNIACPDDQQCIKSNTDDKGDICRHPNKT